MSPRRLKPRKVLVASVGVATLNYIASACSNSGGIATAANLLAPPPIDGGRDAAGDGSRDSGKQPPPSPTVANLMAPAPPGHK